MPAPDPPTRPSAAAGHVAAPRPAPHASKDPARAHPCPLGGGGARRPSPAVKKGSRCICSLGPPRLCPPLGKAPRAHARLFWSGLSVSLPSPIPSAIFLLAPPPTPHPRSPFPPPSRPRSPFCSYFALPLSMSLHMHSPSSSLIHPHPHCHLAQQLLRRVADDVRHRVVAAHTVRVQAFIARAAHPRRIRALVCASGR